MYSKIIKYVSLALLLIGVIVVAVGALMGFDENNALAVDILFYWAYAIVGIAIAAIIGIGSYIAAINNPKGLVRSGLVVLAAAVVIGVVYLIAPGNEAIGYYGSPVSDLTLKLTDTVLLLTYAACAAAVLAIIAGSAVSATRK